MNSRFFTTLFFATLLTSRLYPQAGGESCETATQVCSFPIYSSNNGYSINAPFNICSNPNWVENNLFYSFVAGSTNMEFEVLVSNCWMLDPSLGGGLQGEIYYTEDCINFEQLACFTEPFPGFWPTDFNLSFVAEVGVTYLLMIDGYAGDVCDFNINLIEGSLGVPSINENMEGDFTVCTGTTQLYEVPNNFEEFSWTCNPLNGNFIGATNDNNVTIEWTSPGTSELCTHGLYCNNPSPEVCQTIEINVPTESTQELDLCPGGTVICGGQEIFSPGVQQILLLNEKGCDSTVTCIVNLLPVIPPANLTKTICAPETFAICGQTFTQTGLYTGNCTSFSGCDSTVLLDLAILNPLPAIAFPDSLPCDTISTITLNGSGSNVNTAPGGSTNYQWSGPGIVGPSNGSSVQVSEPGSYCLELVHSRGGVSCSKSSCVQVFKSGQPPVPQLEGDTIICIGENAVFYATIDSSLQMDGFIWTTQNGIPLDTTVSDSIEIVWAAPYQGEICVSSYDECGISSPECLAIEVIAIDTFILIGPMNLCQGETGTYFLQNAGQNNSCQWTVPNGASFVQSGDTINVNFGTSLGGQVCATCTNECGSSQTRCVSITVNNQLPSPQIVQGGQLACSQQSIEYCINNVPGATQYEWTSPFGIVQTAGTCHTINWTTPGNATLCVTASNPACGQSLPTCLDVEVATPPTAQVSGDGSICGNLGEVVFLDLILTGEFPLVIGWTIDGIDQTPLVKSSSPSDIIIGGNQAGIVQLTSVTDANGCMGTVSGIANIVQLDIPQIIGLQIDCDSSNQSYSVSFEVTGGEQSTYGVQPMLGNLNGSFFSSNPIPAGMGFSFEVHDGNNCGQSTVEQAQVDCNCNSKAGDMIEQSIIVCGEDIFQVNYNPSDEIRDNNDVLCFILHSGNPNTPLASNSTPVFHFDSLTMDYGLSYFICPAVGDNDGVGCVDLGATCFDFGGCTEVVFREKPVVAFGDTIYGCLGETILLPFTYAGQLPFDVSLSSSSGSQYDFSFSAPPFQIPLTLDASINFNTIHVEDIYCENEFNSQVTAVVHTPPSASLIGIACNAGNTEYTANIQVTGGDSTSYLVSPNTGTWNGQVFTTQPIQSGSGYNIFIDDNYGCGPSILSGEYDCQCTSQAGTMSPILIEFCSTDPVVVNPATGETIESDDILLYVLHDGIFILGTILQQNLIPEFSFDPSTMMYGQTYYISAIVGNDLGNNTIDLLDVCTNVSNGTPIVFHEKPLATIAPPLPLDCINELVTLAGSSSQTGSTFNWSVISDGEIIGNANIADILVGEAGIYQLLVSTGACSDAATVEVLDNSVNVSASVLATPSQTLDCSTDEISLAGVATGTTNLQFQWFDLNGVISSSPNIQTTDPGNYSFVAYDLASGCADTALVTIDKIEDYPQLSVDQIPSLDCYSPTAWVTGSSQDPNIDFSWIEIINSDTITLANTPEIQIGTAGEYWMLGTSANGCQSALPVNIAADFIPPHANAGPDALLDCYNASVLITGNSNTPNVSYHWMATDPSIILQNNNSQTITIESPSTYLLTITALSNGCSSIDSVVVIESKQLQDGDVIVEQPSCVSLTFGAIIVNMDPIQKQLYFSLDGQTATVTNEFKNVTPGIHNIKVTTLDGCTWETTVEINDFEEPSISLGQDIVVFLGDQVNITANYNIPDNLLDTLIWSPSTLFPCTQMPCSHQTFQPTQLTDVSVTLIDLNGCTATDMVTVFVKKKNGIYAPTAFSPNGDSINDFFMVYAGKSFKSIRQFLVFDRWGSTVFQSSNITPNDESKGWDGSLSGVPANAGVYTWFVIIEMENGEEQVIKGDITIVR